ncbi:MAG: HIT family protein [Nanoarchaeota archaeon]
MTDCSLCQQIKNQHNIIFEDDTTIAMLAPKPAIIGHVIVAPKEHFTILEMVPDWIVSDLFTAANTISTAIFEGLKASGTNILVQNGIPAGQQQPHVSISIIPRKEGDNLPLSWQPKQITTQELTELETKLKDEAKYIGAFASTKPTPLEETKPEIKETAQQEIEEDYQLRQLGRIP